ncbi:hypothetical protein SAMN05216246_11138 [Actinomyces denticolens]|uniref:N-acetyltransferase domain-containing protein n=1 Tax=Actinomyces denticolens TaxID=52767 RepID=A0ABY1IFR2_9ACTO|nr:hypothetical protein [Actinomyces denticolens]SHJ10556.1 hypothetical protein SAMN05216246_11138 [Actinomyces denticolens]
MTNSTPSGPIDGILAAAAAESAEEAAAGPGAASTAPAAPTTPTAPADPALAAALADGRLMLWQADPRDTHRVARLLALRGTTLQEALEAAPGMIDSIPVLVLASLEDPAHPDDVDAAVSVALAGAFILPADPDEGREAVWMVTGLIIDPAAKTRPIGRDLLMGLAEAVDAIDPGAPLWAFVEASEHAVVAGHLAAGFKKVGLRPHCAGITFPTGDGVLLVREPEEDAGAKGPGGAA